MLQKILFSTYLLLYRSQKSCRVVSSHVWSPGSNRIFALTLISPELPSLLVCVYCRIVQIVSLVLCRKLRDSWRRTCVEHRGVEQCSERMLYDTSAIDVHDAPVLAATIENAVESCCHPERFHFGLRIASNRMKTRASRWFQRQAL